MTKKATPRKITRKTRWMKTSPKSVVTVSSVGIEGKVLTEPRRLASGSCVNVEDWFDENDDKRVEMSWMEFVEDRV